MWDSSISSGNLQAFPAWKILWGKWFPLFSSGTWMSEREPGESKGQKMAWYTGSEKVWNVYCQMAWITDSVTGIHCSTPGERKSGQHGCTAEILPYSVSDGRILQWIFPENGRSKKGILLNTIEIIGSQGVLSCQKFWKGATETGTLRQKSWGSVRRRSGGGWRNMAWKQSMMNSWWEIKNKKR